MPTIIDSLIVTLGLDNKDFNKGIKDTDKALNDTRGKADEHAKGIADAGKVASEFFGQMQRSAVKFFAVLTAGKGLINFTSNVISTGANLSRLSKNLGISADSLHRWGKAAELNGGSMEGFLSSVQNMNDQMTQIFMTGESAMSPFLRELGVSIVDGEGKAKKATEVFADIAAAAENMYPDQVERYAYLRKLGLDDGTLNLIVQGAAKVKQALAEQKGFSQKEADEALKIDKRYKEISQTIDKLMRDLIVKLFPSFERIMNSFAEMAETALPMLAGAVETFAELDKATDGWAVQLGLALVALRAITGLGIISGLGSVMKLLKFTPQAVAVGASAYLGNEAGKLIYEKLVKGTDAEDFIGEMVANTLAFFGNKEAADAVEKNTGKRPESVTELIKRNWNQKPTGITKGAGRAERNLNPGNIRYYGQPGIEASSADKGKFIKFNSVEAGYSEMYRQLTRYAKRGIDSISEIINTWAPEFDENGKKINDTSGYIKFMEKFTGFGANQQIDINDPESAAKIMMGITRRENGNWTNMNQALSGIDMQKAGIGGSKTITIGKIEVVTQSKDPVGISRDIKSQLVRQLDGGIQ